MLPVFKPLLVLVFAFTCLSATYASKMEATEILVSGPELKIYYEAYEPSDAETKKITRAVAFLYYFYQHQLKLNLPKNLKIKLRIFGDYYSYKIYQMGFSKSTTDGAFYSSKFGEAVVWKRKNSAVMFKDICHEISHLLVGNLLNDQAKYFKKRPLWINEGLAEYFENLMINEGNIEVQPNLVKLERCREWLIQNKLLSLNDYLAYNNKEWKANDVKEKLYQSRTLGWSLVFFLFSKNEGNDLVGEMLNIMVNNQGNTKHGFDAVVKTYPGGITVLEHDWKFWLLQKDHLAVQKIKNNDAQLPDLTPENKKDDARGQD
jgi:hypothetical protein